MRPVVNHQRNFGLIRHRAEVQDLRRHIVQQILVVMRRAHHRRFIPALGRGIGERHGFPHALHAGPGQQDLIGSGIFGHPIPQLQFFLGREIDALAGRAAHHVTGECGAVPLLNVVLNLGFIKVAVVVERSGDGREDALKLKHEGIIWSGSEARPRSRNYFTKMIKSVKIAKDSMKARPSTSRV